MPHSSSTPRSRRRRRRCHRHRRRQCSHRRTRPRRRAGCRRSAVSFWDVRTSALVDGARTVADAALVVRTHAVVDVVADAIGIGVRCTVTATHAQGVELVSVAVAVSFWDVRTSALVDRSRTVADAHSSRAPTQSSTSSQMPSASASATQSPPHTPKASSWLPSQSQSPSGMSEHPHS